MSNQENIISLANPKRAAIFGVAVAIFTALIVYKLDVVVTLAAVLAVGILALIFANTEVATLLVKEPLDAGEAHRGAKRFPDITASRLPPSKLRGPLTDQSMIYSNEYQLEFVVAMTSSWRA